MRPSNRICKFGVIDRMRQTVEGGTWLKILSHGLCEKARGPRIIERSSDTVIRLPFLAGKGKEDSPVTFMSAEGR